jgi:hypothetical protein
MAEINNDNFLKSCKDIVVRSEATDHLAGIAGGMCAFAFFVIPLIIGLILFIPVVANRRKINQDVKEIVYTLVAKMEFTRVSDMFEFIPAIYVYGALDSLLKDRLSNFALTSDKLYIIKKEN